MIRATIFGLILIFCFNANAQFIDNYGVKIGAGLSNQYWDYKSDVFSGVSGWNVNKTGITAQIYAEKEFGKFFSYRQLIGYTQKGFIDSTTWRFSDGTVIPVIDDRVVFHDLSFDMLLKISPFKGKIKPYIFAGFRGDYLIDYRGVKIDFLGEVMELNTYIYEDFKKITVGGLAGIGCSCSDLVIVDLEYNPAISKKFDSDGLAVNDRFFSLTIGLNINKLLKEKSE